MSIRAVKRWWKSRYAEHRNRKRMQSVGVELSAALDQPLRLVSAGAAGRDSIFWVEGEAGRIAVLRLVNPFKQRAALPANSPFIWLDDARRIDYEWQAYRKGAEKQLTPEPLWHCADAVACRYLPWQPLFSQLQRSPERFWALVGVATAAVARLHDAGLVHMDASLANILADEQSGEAVFVDFEYGPADFLAPGQQRAYDYLRLVESGLKFCPEAQRGGFSEWIAQLGQLVDSETAASDIAPLAPALGRLLADTELCRALKKVFTQLN